MYFKFEQGARHEDLVRALRQAGCVILEDETWQPDNPTLDAYFPGTGTGVYYPTAYGCEQPKLPVEYYPVDQVPPAAWRVGAMSVSFHGGHKYRPSPRRLQEILGFMEAFQQLSPARFVATAEFEQVFAERTAQGLVLHPIWHEYATAEPDEEDDEQER